MRTDCSALQHRLEITARIESLEKQGGEAFFCDVEDDPPYDTLMPEDVDYLGEKLSTRFFRFIARSLEGILERRINREYQVEVRGEENLLGIGGAVVTSNHFSRIENLAVKTAVGKAQKKHRFYKVVREGNYSMPGALGFLLKYCDTLPLSSNLRTMAKFTSAVKELLKRGDFILIYPEQAMWWNYTKPRPYRAGAFKLAAANGVPVLPCFVTMSKTDRIKKNGAPQLKYTVHILPPVYPAEHKPARVNAKEMQEKNFELCREKYEAVYGIPLMYSTCERETASL